MRRILAVVLLLATIASVAAADPVAPPVEVAAPADPIAPPADLPAPVPPMAMMGTLPNLTLGAGDDGDGTWNKHPHAAVGIMTGLYAGFIGWMYYAWYNKHKPLADYKFGGDGWLGYRTYAGGADKFGHAWATMSLARVGTEILNQYGGYDRTKSIFISAAMSELLFIGVEVKDGFFYEFSFSDISGDTTGFLMALALQLWPRLDELFDYRVQYFPSAQYANQVTAGSAAPLGGKLNIAEDYSGQTYFLAFHLGGIHQLTALPYGTLAKFVDVAFGFDTRGYKPEPASGPLPIDQHHQNMFLGVSFNAQGFFDWMFEAPTRHNSLRKFTHATFEVFNLPFTGGPIIQYTRTPTGSVTQDGA